jgi:uncharacterized protein YceK
VTLDMSARLPAVVVIVATALLLGGCGTLMTQGVAHKDQAVSCRDLCGSTPNIYSGTAYSVRMMLFPMFVNACSGGESRLAFGMLYPFLLLFLIVDIPLSFAADTIILPYTAYRQASRGNICQSSTQRPLR